MGDVNFSDLTVRPKDPHCWREVKAQLVYLNRVLYTVPIWICGMCDLVETVHPQYVRSDEGHTCITTHP